MRNISFSSFQIFLVFFAGFWVSFLVAFPFAVFFVAPFFVFLAAFFAARFSDSCTSLFAGVFLILAVAFAFFRASALFATLTSIFFLKPGALSSSMPKTDDKSWPSMIRKLFLFARVR